jgi:hypothetical protein
MNSIEKKVCIHQPDFMPWLGFFAKIMKSDVWVLLDHVENNPRDAAFWGRRVKVALNGKAAWLSIPLVKEVNRIGVPISEMQISMDFSKVDFSRKNLNLIEINYRKTPFFNQIYPLIESYFLSDEPLLLNRNVGFIMAVFKMFEHQPKVIRSSELDCQERSNELLLEIIEKVGGTFYISGDGAGGYMNMDRFAEKSIGVEFNQFMPFDYAQLNTSEFLPGLSVIDILMNLGPEQTALQLKNKLIHAN